MKIIIVDNHQNYSEGLKHLLELTLPGSYIKSFSLNSFSNRYQIIETPDLLIIDPYIEKEISEKIIKRLIKNDTKVILLTSDNNHEKDVLDLLKYRISGYLFKSSRTAKLISLIKGIVFRDSKYIEPSVANILISKYQNEILSDKNAEKEYVNV
ncbi:response regulator (plasmid) [Metabacillus halosaccharovorans]|uniref:response regulator n=1 Tax=Metabacillus halosaccharovorans TaxID=930124 RepID=UPI001C1F59EC|nr:response regulator [Metabacillus halosaccharovorans]MBU7595862.1 response regulator transcription factor [Metabacillus halosaccharovorans]